MIWIIDQVVYDTNKATLLASDEAGLPLSGVELYSTKKGTFFKLENRLAKILVTPLTADEAISEYNELDDKKVNYQKAFPSVKFSEA